MRRLILYEPPINVGRERSLIELGDRLAALMATGDREAVLVTFLEEGARYPPDSIAAQRSAARVAGSARPGAHPGA